MQVAYENNGEGGDERLIIYVVLCTYMSIFVTFSLFMYMVNQDTFFPGYECDYMYAYLIVRSFPAHVYINDT